jgi:glycosyltransferase involved in cell wall biosynthesis
MADQLGVAHRVSFTGRIDYLRAPEYLGLGDIAVSPKLSKTEANGKLLNYIACGLPTVVFDTPINREILGDVGFYAEYGSVDDLARQIMSLAGDSFTRENLSRASRTRALDVFSWDKLGCRMTDIYQRNFLKPLGEGK